MDAAEHRAVALNAKLGRCWRPSCLICPRCIAWSACITKGPADVAPFWDAAAAPPAAPDGALVVCSADGKGAPIRGAEPAPAVERMHASGGPQPGRKKIAWVGSVYTGMPFTRTPEEVCKSLFEAPPAEASPARPKPQCKRLRASLLRDAQ